MSSRPNLSQESVITSQSMAADITSSPTILKLMTVGSYSYSWSGSTPVGAVSVQVSNDYKLNADGSVKNAGTWVTLYFTLNGATVVSSAPITGNTGQGLIEWSTGAYAIRTKYTATSGTGTLQAVFNGKVC